MLEFSLQITMKSLFSLRLSVGHHRSVPDSLGARSERNTELGTFRGASRPRNLQRTASLGYQHYRGRFIKPVSGRTGSLARAKRWDDS